LGLSEGELEALFGAARELFENAWKRAWPFTCLVWPLAEMGFGGLIKYA